MENWILFVLISIIFFVLGQTFLKFDKNNGIISCCYFTISTGVIGFLTLIYLLNNNINNDIKIDNKIIYSSLAGILFFFGNLFWIYSIKDAPSLSLIRVIMAGGETALLLLVGYLLFNQYLSLRQVIGTILILLGVHVISL